MAKISHTVKPDLNGKEVMKQWSSEYKVQLPPPHFYIHLCFHNEDMVEIKLEYKVLCAPAITSKDYFKNLGYLGVCDTLMYVSDRKAKFPGTSLYALGRSWFKEGVTEKAKGYLKEVVEQAKAAMVLARMSRKKGKMVQKQVLSTSALRGKKKFVPKIRSLNDILRAIDQEGDN